MLLMIDDPMIYRFIDDVDNFQTCSDERFIELDADDDGLLSRGDLGRKLSGSVVFDKFDVDGNGSIDREEFRPMRREILNALAEGIGAMPVIVVVEEDSLLMKAYENEWARIYCKLDKVIESNGVEITKKKRSKKIFGMCSCSPRYLGED